MGIHCILHIEILAPKKNCRKINGVWGGDLLDGMQHYAWPEVERGQPATQLELF